MDDGLVLRAPGMKVIITPRDSPAACRLGRQRRLEALRRGVNRCDGQVLRWTALVLLEGMNPTLLDM